MKIEYDEESDIAYIYFKEIENGEVEQTISLNESVNIDLDKDGKTLGIEILEASKNLPSNALKSAVIIN
ncbi:MAG: DUF2283 domain-containing protein [Candidatus Pacearchaeota archaeon]|jgi:uncharacterized protein YuzE